MADDKQLYQSDEMEDSKENAETGPKQTPMSKSKYCRGLVLNVLKIWVFCITVSASVFGIMHNEVLDNRSETISRPDMVDIKSRLGGYQTLLCEGIRVSSLFNSFKTYLLDHTPQIDNSGRDKFNFRDELNVRDNIEKRSFHVLQGSEIRAQMCFKEHTLNSNETLKVLIFQGQESFDDWDKTNQSNGGAIQSHVISSSRNCSENTSEQIYLNAPSTDDYFFVYLKTSSEFQIVCNLEYDLNLVRYDVRSATVVCASGSNCDVPFPFNSDSNVVLQFKPEEGKLTYESSCTYRTAFGLSMFLAVPGGIALIVSGLFLWCEFMSKPENLNKDAVQPQLEGRYASTDSTNIKTVYSEHNQIT